MPTLSGDGHIDSKNLLMRSWGLETRLFSLSNAHDESGSLSLDSDLKFSLSGRLRQTFEFLSNKTLAMVYSSESRFSSNQSLNLVGTVLMNHICDISQRKLEEHLKMLDKNMDQAINDRNQCIRIGSQSKEAEKADPLDVYKVDLFVEFGANCV